MAFSRKKAQKRAINHLTYRIDIENANGRNQVVADLKRKKDRMKNALS